jgi:hypothetical protein
MMILIPYCIGRFGKTKKNVKRDKINNSIVEKITSEKGLFLFNLLSERGRAFCDIIDR